jgi:AcrR family transcriptional regulator
MGIKERQERDREAVRRSILDAARDLFVREGFENVSIRKVAERIEYSPAAIYSYFPSKDDIFFALAEEGFRLLYRPEQHEAVHGLPPIERIRALFWQFYEFSGEHPQYFALMFLDRSVPQISRVYERFAFAREMKEHLISDIQRAIADGAMPADVPPAVVFRLLATGMVGVATARLCHRISAGENADDLARDMLTAILTGLQAGIPLHSQPEILPPSDTRAESRSES